MMHLGLYCRVHEALGKGATLCLRDAILCSRRATTVSPTFKGPTPFGVPVRIRSPACRVMHLLMYEISCGILKIMSFVFPRWRTCPLTYIACVSEPPLCCCDPSYLQLKVQVVGISHGILWYYIAVARGQERQKTWMRETAYLTGQKVSNPLAMHQGSPFFAASCCNALAVMSMATT